jgi:DNA-binding transcriptional LysR family regulator
MAGTARGMGILIAQINRRISSGTCVPFGTMFVAPAIPALLTRYPDLIVDLSFTDDIVNLLEQKADIAIRMGDLPDAP